MTSVPGGPRPRRWNSSRWANSAATRPRLSHTPREDLLDLVGGFFRKRGARDCRGRCDAPEASGPTLRISAPAKFADALAVHQLAHRPAQHRDREPRRLSHRAAALSRLPKALPRSCVAMRIQNVTMILPNTCRLSSRARPRSKSASATSVSITGGRPPAILARLSRMLRIEAPNEPKMRYCCR